MTPYNPFRHLCRSIFCGKSDYMMFAAYFDDSGTHSKSRVATVAGYISNVGQWDIFNKEWAACLKDFKVKEMHRSDLESFEEEFLESNGWNPNRRKAFLQKLHPIMKKRTKVAIGSAVIRETFEEIVPETIKKLFGGVYGWCAHECITLARIWAEKCQRKNIPPMQWVFEAGTTGYGQVDQMFQSLNARADLRADWRIKGWSFQGKDVLPLQAADVIAYEVYKHVENQILDKGEKHDIRFSMADLFRECDVNYLKWWSRDRLIEWVNTATLNGKPLKDYK